MLPNPNCSFRSFATFGEMNAGKVGPTCIFLIPRYSNARSTITAFCSYHAMLNSIGRSFISFALKISLSFNATTAHE